MKNWKCAVGAAILAPFGVIVVLGSVWLITYVLLIVPFMKYILAGFSLLMALTLVWIVLYDHCVEYWNNRK